ncbi:MAG: hypothetical protein KDA79_14065 [Planctomycetaceae bacterium]|nr:hypothetical protein [Planctomycetaceae bacterium]
MLTISGKALGRRRPLFADFSIPTAPHDADSGDGSTTLRDLIDRIVRHEVQSFRERQQDRQLLRALTARQIDAALETGKVTMGESEVEPQDVDEDAAVGTALVAFEDGLYLVAIDGTEYRDLDRQVFLQPDSRITFIRLTLLAGG